MIIIPDIASAMPVADNLFEPLQTLYSRLPDTRCTCDQPGVCCSFLPEITVLEALQWIRVMQGMPHQERTARFESFVAFYLTNPARISGCPFKDDGSCSIYTYRTFGCRSYGLWSQKMGKERTQESRAHKKALRGMWKRFGVDLPVGTVEFEIDYCDRVGSLSGPPLRDADILDLLKQVYDLDKPLGSLQSRFEEEYHSDFSFLITSLVLGVKGALLEKIAIIKELTKNGEDSRLRAALSQVSPDILDF
jgi:Fe-S-cluster containining protein